MRMRIPARKRRKVCEVVFFSKYRSILKYLFPEIQPILIIYSSHRDQFFFSKTFEFSHEVKMFFPRDGDH